MERVTITLEDSSIVKLKLIPCMQSDNKYKLSLCTGCFFNALTVCNFPQHDTCKCLSTTRADCTDMIYVELNP